MLSLGLIASALLASSQAGAAGLPPNCGSVPKPGVGCTCTCTYVNGNTTMGCVSGSSTWSCPPGPIVPIPGVLPPSPGKATFDEELIYRIDLVQ
jgi:hypothetical protein